MSQTSAILAHLKSGQTITQASAIMHFRCFRLSGRIEELRNAGHDIKFRMVPNTWNSGRHGVYYMEIQN